MLRNLDAHEQARLLDAINSIWDSGILPESWSTAIVVPIRKTGSRRHCCTAASIADVVSCQEEAKQQGDVALLILLDVQAAFDGLPHSTIEQALDELGVRVGGTVSSPRPITTGVPQGSVLSPFLFNLVMAGLPSAIQQGLCHRVFCSVYAQALQRALVEVQCFLASRGLVLSATKSEALFVHQRGARATSRIRTFRIDGTDLPWRQKVRYLGLTIDHRLTCILADKPHLLHLDHVGRAAERLLARGNSCSSTWAIRLFEAAGTSAVLYALPLVTLRTTRLRRLETSRRKWICRLLGVPQSSQVAVTLAEEGVLPLNLLLLQRGLTHTDRLHHVPDGRALRARLSGRPHSRMGMLSAAYMESLGPPASHPALPPPPTLPPLQVSLDFGSTSKRHTPAAALNQSAAAFLDEIKGSTLLFTDSSVLPATGQGAAALVAPQLNATRTCRLPFPGSSFAAELAGLHLAADLIATIPHGPVVVLCDSLPALQLLPRPLDNVATTSLLSARLQTLEAAGHQISLHWVPDHSGIEGNDLADALAKSAHTDGSPVSFAVTQHDFARPLITQMVRALHPDRRIAAYKPFRQLSDQLPGRDRALPLRLRIGCTWTPSSWFCSQAAACLGLAAAGLAMAERFVADEPQPTSRLSALRADHVVSSDFESDLTDNGSGDTIFPDECLEPVPPLTSHVRLLSDQDSELNLLAVSVAELSSQSTEADAELHLLWAT
ncbi:uncharacterized protein LOC144113008 [Amblyomma americanum]